MEEYQIAYDDKIIKFYLKRKNVKNVNLNIRPDMSIVVSANEKVPIDFLCKFVTEKAPWIIKKLEYFKEALPESGGLREYVSGESFKYLGKQYRLKVEESQIECVKYFRGYIYLFVRDKDDFKRKEKMLNAWFKEKADSIFNEILDKMLDQVRKYNIIKPKIIMRVMKARWGSCLRDSNTILINSELIKAPKYCIEYVILHELLHFRFKNHNYEFNSFLSSLMPDWKFRKRILDEEIVRDL